jgi:leukotriene-A4 hydrolase
MNKMRTPLVSLVLGLCWAFTAMADEHSYSNPEQLRVRHMDLNLTVDFDQQQLIGDVVLDVEQVQAGARELVLDTRDLIIASVEAGDGANWAPVQYVLGDTDPTLGAALRIAFPEGATKVRINYASRPQSTGLQWLQPAQTADGKFPYMYSQAQAIHARSFIPLQDSPAVRVTYRATISTAPQLRAVMSAGNDPAAPLSGVYQFEMPQPIPSYLIALAVGDLHFKAMGSRTGVYAEPSVLPAAAAEFADTESMLEKVEILYGNYRWDRYDLLILPPSFPWGGMENPRLSFITPTVIAGDKSLVGLIAHELAPSWSGNTVTNATWNDIWLNEGFTTYLTYRIIEVQYGVERANMERLLGYQSLQRALAELPAADQRLVLDLRGRDPDAGFTEIPYEKGALLVTELEQAVGRPVFDEFLRRYFDNFAFRSITTSDFLEFIDTVLVAEFPDQVSMQRINLWLSTPGLPEGAPVPFSPAFEVIDGQRSRWLEGELTAGELDSEGWSVHEWLHFLNGMPRQLQQSQMLELDKTFSLTASSNSEIAHSWLLLAVRSHYQPAYAALRAYLLTIGRRKLIVPLYKALLEDPADSKLAAEIFAQARPGYQAVAVQSIDSLFAAQELPGQ